MTQVEASFPKWVYGVFAAVTGAAGLSLWNNTMTLGVLSTKIDSIGERIKSLEANMLDGTRMRYTSEDAAKDRSSMMSLWETIDRRTTSLETDVRSLREWRGRVEGKP